MKKIGQHSFPDHWEIHPLSDVLFLQEGPGIRKKEYQDDGYPMINVRCVQDGYIDMSKARAANMELATTKWAHFQIDENDILFTISGTIGRSAVVKKSDLPLLMNTSVVRFKPIHPDLTLDFAYQYLRSDFFVEMLKDMSTGTAIQNVGPSHLKKLFVPLPPLPEQQRIVSILDQAFAAIDKAKANAEQNLQNAKDLFESFLQGVFENGDWDTISIEAVCDEIFAGGDAPKDNYSKEPNEKHNIPIYANAVKDRGLYGYTDFARVTKPCVTIAARGSGTGHTELRNEQFLPIVRLIVCIPNSELISTEFLKYTIDNLVIQRSGSAIPQLTVPMIKDYQIPVPSVGEQKQLIEQAETLRAETLKLEAVYQKKMDDLDELKKSILQKAFAGELETETLETA